MSSWRAVVCNRAAVNLLRQFAPLATCDVKRVAQVSRLRRPALLSDERVLRETAVVTNADELTGLDRLRETQQRTPE